jgi:hypothetical protein
MSVELRSLLRSLLRNNSPLRACSAIITYENILLAHKDALENLNITLCRECFHPIKADEGEYCDSCQPE